MVPISSQDCQVNVEEGRLQVLFENEKELHSHVYCSTIHNSQVMETAKMLHY
jgi:hypothetical protein